MGGLKWGELSHKEGGGHGEAKLLNKKLGGSLVEAGAGTKAQSWTDHECIGAAPPFHSFLRCRTPLKHPPWVCPEVDTWAP